MERDLERIKRRKESFAIKQEGDKLFVGEDMAGALKKYEEAVDLDSRNEYAWANLGVIYMKK